MCPCRSLGLCAWSTQAYPDVQPEHSLKTFETGSFETVAFFGRKKLSQGHLVLACNGLQFQGS